MDSLSKPCLVKKGRETAKAILLMVFLSAVFSVFAIPSTIIALGLIEDVMRMADENHIEAFCKLFSLYLLGFRYIGIPMAVASAGFYLWGTDFPRSPWYKTLVYLRNALHPISFVLSSETVQTHLNRRCDYDSPIQTMIDEENPTPWQVIGYIFLSASMWPIRVSLSGAFVSFLLGIASACILLVITVYILKAIWFLICLPFKLFTTTQKNQTQSCDNKS